MGRRKSNKIGFRQTTPKATKKESEQLVLGAPGKPEENEDAQDTYVRKVENLSAHTLSEEQVGLMLDLVEVPTHTNQTKEMRKFIRQALKEIPGVNYFTHDGNIYVIKGSAEVYPCVVAHTDTVHYPIDNIVAYVNGDTVFAMNGNSMRQYGTGGDDKVGIWVALECLKRFDNIKVALFRDEESGCNGSRKALMDFFTNVTMVLQCDRRGRYDFTDSIGGTPMLNKDFKEAIKDIVAKHKRVYVTGAMTDVLQLVHNGLPVVAANMSCGYYDPHSSNETINLLHMQEAFNFVCDLITEVGNTKWPFPDRDKKPEYTGGYYGVANAQGFHSASAGGTYYGGGQSRSGQPSSRAWDNNSNYHIDDGGGELEEQVGSDYELVGGNWVKKKLKDSTFIGQFGLDVTDKNFRTKIDDYCENCGEILNSKVEKHYHNCKKCYEDIMENKMPDSI